MGRKNNNPFSPRGRGSTVRQAVFCVLIVAGAAMLVHAPNRAWALASDAGSKLAGMVAGVHEQFRARLSIVPALADEVSLSALIGSLRETTEARRSGRDDGTPSEASGTTVTAQRASARHWLPAYDDQDPAVHDMCEALAGRLSSVGLQECLRTRLVDTGFDSVRGRPLVATRIPTEGRDAPRVMLIGGHHGDELTSVTTMVKWIHELRSRDTGVDWFVFPAVNPDGVLARPASRTNANGVDLNRNFPAENWRSRPQGGRARYQPGSAPASEPETQMLIAAIDALRPAVILSVHGPLGLVDLDGHVPAPDKLGHLPPGDLRAYPGSLGSFGFKAKNIPVVTIELKNAAYMPPAEAIRAVLLDVESWVRAQFLAVEAKDSPEQG